MYNQSPLKWAGSKNKVLPILLPVLEKYKTVTFCEPFAGACNVSLNFESEYYTLNDSNADIQNFLMRLANNYDELCSELVELFSGKHNYYELRDLFNSDDIDNTKKAALFLYLNKHGFNGLCRYNKQGKFNVPEGKFSSTPKIPHTQLLNLNKLLTNSLIHNLDFEDVFKFVGADTLIYSDPPYVPLTSDFNYTSEGFNWRQQVRLKELSKANHNVSVISNHWTPLTEELYSDADEIHVFDVQRTISCNGNKRKRVQECIVVYK